MPRRRRINGDEEEVGYIDGGEAGVYYDRPYKTLWNRWGEEHTVPADSVMLGDLLAQGWSMRKPANPEPRPLGMKMRNGSVFMYEDTAKEPSSAEVARMNRTQGQASGGPTATYYSANGDRLENLPADPQSMKEYLEMGLSLTPPARTAGRPRKLQAV